MGSTIWSIFTARRYVKRGICRRRVSAGFVLRIVSRGPSAIAELLVSLVMDCNLLWHTLCVGRQQCFIPLYIRHCQRSCGELKCTKTEGTVREKAAKLDKNCRSTSDRPCYHAHAHTRCTTPLLLALTAPRRTHRRASALLMT